MRKRALHLHLRNHFLKMSLNQFLIQLDLFYFNGVNIFLINYTSMPMKLRAKWNSIRLTKRLFENFNVRILKMHFLKCGSRCILTKFLSSLDLLFYRKYKISRLAIHIHLKAAKKEAGWLLALHINKSKALVRLKLINVQTLILLIYTCYCPKGGQL